jgi:hypothetical protein
MASIMCGLSEGDEEADILCLLLLTSHVRVLDIELPDCAENSPGQKILDLLMSAADPARSISFHGFPHLRNLAITFSTTDHKSSVDISEVLTISTLRYLKVTHLNLGDNMPEWRCPVRASPILSLHINKPVLNASGSNAQIFLNSFARLWLVDATLKATDDITVFLLGLWPYRNTLVQLDIYGTVKISGEASARPTLRSFPILNTLELHTAVFNTGSAVHEEDPSSPGSGKKSHVTTVLADFIPDQLQKLTIRESKLGDSKNMPGTKEWHALSSTPPFYNLAVVEYYQYDWNHYTWNLLEIFSWSKGNIQTGTRLHSACNEFRQTLDLEEIGPVE